MDGIDDLARFHLWFMETAKLGRPHLLGHSIGGWTAAEMATMSLARSTGSSSSRRSASKPRSGRSSTSSTTRPAQLLTMTVHDAKTVPEWQELYGRPPSPQEVEIATRNREMAARLTWKPYMHNPRLAHFLRA